MDENGSELGYSKVGCQATDDGMLLCAVYVIMCSTESSTKGDCADGSHQDCNCCTYHG